MQANPEEVPLLEFKCIYFLNLWNVSLIYFISSFLNVHITLLMTLYFS